jgi:hypothetical protein
MRLAPSKKLTDGPGVGRARVSVANVRREEFDEAPRSPLAGAGDRDGKFLQAGSTELAGADWDDFLGHGRGAIDAS